jgi:hypothetical protein
MDIINKSYKESNKESGLYSGIFWIVDSDNVLNNDDYCITIPCDISGNPLSLIGLNAKSGTTYNHELTWKTLPPKLTHNKPYNYYPRGRVQIKNNKATVYLNPNINTDEIQQFIINKFNLGSLSSISFKSDGSNHYKSHLG